VKDGKGIVIKQNYTFEIRSHFPGEYSNYVNNTRTSRTHLFFTYCPVINLSNSICLVRGSRPGKQVQLAEYEIKYLCQKAREIFISQPILLELEAPIKICGGYSFFAKLLSS
jgi:hypothetical protein